MDVQPVQSESVTAATVATSSDTGSSGMLSGVALTVRRFSGESVDATSSASSVVCLEDTTAVSASATTITTSTTTPITTTTAATTLAACETSHGTTPVDDYCEETMRGREGEVLPEHVRSDQPDTTLACSDCGRRHKHGANDDCYPSQPELNPHPRYLMASCADDHVEKLHPLSKSVRARNGEPDYTRDRDDDPKDMDQTIGGISTVTSDMKRVEGSQGTLASTSTDEAPEAKLQTHSSDLVSSAKVATASASGVSKPTTVVQASIVTPMPSTGLTDPRAVMVLPNKHNTNDTQNHTSSNHNPPETNLTAPNLITEQRDNAKPSQNERQNRNQNQNRNQHQDQNQSQNQNQNQEQANSGGVESKSRATHPKSAIRQGFNASQEVKLKSAGQGDTPIATDAGSVPQFESARNIAAALGDSSSVTDLAHMSSAMPAVPSTNNASMTVSSPCSMSSARVPALAKATDDEKSSTVTSSKPARPSSVSTAAATNANAATVSMSNSVNGPKPTANAQAPVVMSSAVTVTAAPAQTPPHVHSPQQHYQHLQVAHQQHAHQHHHPHSHTHGHSHHHHHHYNQHQRTPSVIQAHPFQPQQTRAADPSSVPTVPALRSAPEVVIPATTDVPFMPTGQPYVMQFVTPTIVPNPQPGYTMSQSAHPNPHYIPPAGFPAHVQQQPNLALPTVPMQGFVSVYSTAAASPAPALPPPPPSSAGMLTIPFVQQSMSPPSPQQATVSLATPRLDAAVGIVQNIPGTASVPLHAHQVPTPKAHSRRTSLKEASDRGAKQTPSSRPLPTGSIDLSVAQPTADPGHGPESASQPTTGNHESQGSEVRDPEQKIVSAAALASELGHERVQHPSEASIVSQSPSQSVTRLRSSTRSSWHSFSHASQVVPSTPTVTAAQVTPLIPHSPAVSQLANALPSQSQPPLVQPTSSPAPAAAAPAPQQVLYISPQTFATPTADFTFDSRIQPQIITHVPSSQPNSSQPLQVFQPPIPQPPPPPPPQTTYHSTSAHIPPNAQFVSPIVPMFTQAQLAPNAIAQMTPTSVVTQPLAEMSAASHNLTSLPQGYSQAVPQFHIVPNNTMAAHPQPQLHQLSAASTVLAASAASMPHATPGQYLAPQHQSISYVYPAGSVMGHPQATTVVYVQETVPIGTTAFPALAPSGATAVATASYVKPPRTHMRNFERVEHNGTQVHEYIPIPGRLISQATAKRHNTTGYQINPNSATLTKASLEQTPSGLDPPQSDVRQ